MFTKCCDQVPFSQFNKSASCLNESIFGWSYFCYPSIGFGSSNIMHGKTWWAKTTELLKLTKKDSCNSAKNL